jgi:hypothetical protein
MLYVGTMTTGDTPSQRWQDRLARWQNRPARWQDRLARWAANRSVARKLSAHQGLGLILMMVMLLGALASLIGLNYLVGHLWGELVYGLVVTTAAIWGLSHVRPVRWLLREWDEPGFSVPRAALWATFAVMAFPVVLLRGKWAAIALLAVPVGWMGYRAARHVTRRKFGPARPERRGWVYGTIGVLCLASYLWGLPHTPYLSKIVVAESRSGALPQPAREDADNAQLAWLVRPVLLFDKTESRAPLDIVDTIRSRRMWACTDGDCSQVERLSDLHLAVDYIRIEDVTGVRGGAGGSAYYYHVYDRDESAGRIYVDYWWYFTRNPSPVGATVGCGPAARWVGVTCHDHPSDWEGVTVVLDRCAGPGERCVPRGEDEFWKPVAVRYAQHEQTVSYVWEPTLVRLWAEIPPLSLVRPYVYVAKDSHASYPTACSKGCKQYARYVGKLASYPLVGRRRDEGSFDGGLEWRWNDARCIRIDPGSPPPRKGKHPDCLLPLPITEKGLAASWNAYPGPWGTQTCIVAGTYCDTSKAPPGPSQQHRYREPGAKGPLRCLVSSQRPPAKPELEDCEEIDPAGEVHVARVAGD